MSPRPGATSRRAVDRYHRVFAQSALAQALVTRDGTITSVNSALCALLGAEPRDLIGAGLLERVVGERRPADLLLLEAVGHGRLDEAAITRRRVTSTEPILDQMLVISPVEHPAGHIDEIAVVVVDASAHASRNRGRSEWTSGWRSLLADVNDIALVTDVELRASYVSPSFSARLGHPAAEVLDGSLLDLVHREDRDRVAAAVRRLVGEGTTKIRLRFLLRTGSTSWRQVEGHVVNLMHDADIGGLVVTLRPLDDRTGQRAEQLHGVGHDRLTGLPNRTTIMDRIHEAVAREARGDERCALLFVDVDSLTAVNDAFGQEVGDQALRLVADQLCDLVRTSGIVGRYAGDEFAVLLEDVPDAAAVEALAQRVASGQGLELPLPGGVTIRLTTSVGLAFGPTLSADALVAEAEAATSHAKTLGRGRAHVLADGVRDRVSDRRTLGAELAAAVAQDRLTVHYQPIVDLSSGAIVSFEALVRWQHPRRGLLGPDAFLALAEALDLRRVLDAWVLGEACRAAAEWGLGRDRPVTVAVNVAPDDLIGPGFADAVEDALTRSGLSATSLVLEVTETAVLADEDAARLALKRLAALGVEMSIDDFGTGYSSILQLRQLPFGKLKIDREFVRGLPHSSEDLAICASVIGLADRIGVRSVAEGVETAAQAAVLAELGCQFGQGFFWSRAVPEEQARRLLLRAPWQRG